MADLAAVLLLKPFTALAIILMARVLAAAITTRIHTGKIKSVLLRRIGP